MDRSYAGVLAAVAVATATAAGGVSCSLLAPSDEALMGGGVHDASVPTDAKTDATRRDAEGGSMGPDGPAGSDGSDATGCTCAPTPPAGWTLVAFAASSGSCPDGFGPPQALEVAPPDDGGAACSCQCAVEGGTCDTGQVSLVFAGDAACSGSSIALPISASCASVPNTPYVAADTYLQVTPPGPVSCGATTVSTLPPPASSTLCAVGAGPVDAGACPSGSACEPSVAAPFMLCIAQTGTVPCPSGWSNAYQVGTSFTDTRACSSCACGAVPCTGTVQVWTAGACNGTPDVAAAMDDHCDQSSNGAFTARRYEAVITDGGCAVTTPSTLAGGLAPQDAQTVCCL